MRRLAAIVALAGVISSPAVAQSRLFCRTTGAEMSDCAEQATPAVPVLRSADCCERRVSLPLPDGKLAGDRAVVSPILSGLPAVRGSPALPRPRVRFNARARLAGAGPPLFVQHNALLI